MAHLLFVRKFYLGIRFPLSHLTTSPLVDITHQDSYEIIESSSDILIITILALDLPLTSSMSSSHPVIY